MNTEAKESVQLAEKFLAVTVERDLEGMRALFHEDAKFWTNVKRIDSSREERLERIALEFRTFVELGFDEPRISGFSGGFLIRAVTRGTLPGDLQFAFPIAIVGDTQAGKITRFEEYFDPAPVEPILAAMARKAVE